jgi:hypothetical protein
MELLCWLAAAAHLEAEVFDACGLQQLVEVPEEVAGGDGFIMELWKLKHVDGSKHRLIEVLPAWVRWPPAASQDVLLSQMPFSQL